MQSFASSTLSLPASAEKKSKRNILRRLSLGKTKTAASTSSLASSSTANLASRSTATLAVAPSEECASRRAFDLFSSGPSRPTIDAHASMPSSPRMPKTPTHGSQSTSAKVSFDTRSASSMARSRSASSAAARTSTNSSRSKTDDAPPVPPVPKLYLISDEVFVIAAPPAARSSASRLSESSTDSTGMTTSTTSSSTSTSLPSPMLSSRSSNSCRSSGSWLDSLGSPSEEDTPVFPGIKEEPAVAPRTSSMRSRSSLDEIDDQMLLNLCEIAVHKSPIKAAAAAATTRSTGSESGSSTPTPRARPARSHARSASQQVVPPIPAMPASYKRMSHVRSGSAPLSLGPLPPQPTEPPTEAVLRKTDQIKKRYSRQGSPLITSSPVLGGSPEISSAAFTAPRPAPGTPKLDRVSSLRSLESALSVDLRKASRNHKRSVSKSSGRSFESTFTLPKEVKLTPGHVATPTQDIPQPELEMELVSRFSEDSDAGGDDPRRLLALLSPVLGSVSRMTGFAASSDAGTSTDDSRRHSRISGSKTPEMVARSSSSSSSSYSDLSELTSSVVDDTVFDLSRKSLDYKAVYALAQEYAKSSNSVTTNNSTSRKKLSAAKSQPASFSLWNRQQNKLPDPIDRSYHLRKY